MVTKKTLNKLKIDIFCIVCFKFIYIHDHIVKINLFLIRNKYYNSFECLFC